MLKIIDEHEFSEKILNEASEIMKNKLDIDELNVVNNQKDGHSTRNLGQYILISVLGAFRIIYGILKSDLNILEIGSGNRWISSHLQKIGRVNIIAMDALKHKSSYMKVHQYRSHEAVEKYWSRCNVLLMIAPPPSNPLDAFNINPSGYILMDYMAIKTVEDIGKPAILLKIGQMRPVDGTWGINHYLKKRWKTIKDIQFAPNEYVSIKQLIMK